MTKRFALLQLKGKAGPLTFSCFSNARWLYLHAERFKHMLKSYLLIVIANILLTNNKEKENYYNNHNNTTSVIDDGDYGSRSNNNPIPIFCVSLFQIPMFYFCVFVRREGLGDFSPSVSQPQKISMKGSLEKCWNCWWLLWWDGVCISRNSNVLLKNGKSSAKPSLKSAPK